MQKCKVCGVNKPDHQTERLYDNGKRIIVEFEITGVWGESMVWNMSKENDWVGVS